MQKSFSKTLDISKPYDVSNDITICRGDNVQLAFTFTNGNDAFDISSATKARLYAKRINEKGFVNPDESPLFAKEITLSQPANTVSFNIPTTSTSGNAGEYLLVCILLSSDDSIITAQSMPLSVFENGYTGVYTPDEDFRDEVLDALSQAQQSATTATAKAEEAAATYQQGLDLYNQGIEEANDILSACNSAKTETQALKSECQTLEETTSSLAAQTAQNTTACSTLKTQSETARDQAIAAKNQAQEIVDPDNLIGQLFQTKLDKGLIYCNGGFAKVPQSAFLSLSKATMLIRFARKGAPTSLETLCALGDGGTTQTGFLVRLTTDARFSVLCYFRKAGGTDSNGPHVAAYNIAEYLDGKIHAFALCWSGTQTRIFIDGELKGQSAISAAGMTVQSGTPGISFGARTTTNSEYFRGKVSDFAVLNYDASEVDSDGNYTSAYSIADYQNGAEIPPWSVPVVFGNGKSATANTTNAACVWDGANWSMTQTSNAATIKSMLYYIPLNIGQKLRIKFSNLTGGVLADGKYGFFQPVRQESDQINVSTTSLDAEFTAQTPITLWRFQFNCAAVEDSASRVPTVFENFTVERDGAIVALENYTFKNKIRDTSGNGNTATVSGVLAGDRDNAVVQMYEAFAAQYTADNP